jgi:hypothetical protein
MASPIVRNGTSPPPRSRNGKEVATIMFEVTITNKVSIGIAYYDIEHSHPQISQNSQIFNSFIWLVS